MLLYTINEGIRSHQKKHPNPHFLGYRSNTYKGRNCQHREGERDSDWNTTLFFPLWEVFKIDNTFLSTPFSSVFHVRILILCQNFILQIYRVKGKSMTHNDFQGPWRVKSSIVKDFFTSWGYFEKGPLGYYLCLRSLRCLVSKDKNTSKLRLLEIGLFCKIKGLRYDTTWSSP